MRLVLADAREGRGLAHYLDRLLALDGRASVRLQAAGGVLGAWGGPPLDAVSLRPVALAEPAEVDVTVSALRLREALDPAGHPVELPGAVTGPAWAGLLPPRTGWARRATLASASVGDAVRVGAEAYRRRTASDPGADPTQVAAQVWDRPLAADLPLRAGHAAVLLDLLPPDGSGECGVLAAGPWRRLACPAGSVAVRVDTLAGLGLVVPS